VTPMTCPPSGWSTVMEMWSWLCKYGLNNFPFCHHQFRAMSTLHQQQPLYLARILGCLWWLWQLWWNLVPTDGEIDTFRCPGNGLCSIQTSILLCPECGDVYTPSEWQVCYTLQRGSGYALASDRTPGEVYTFLQWVPQGTSPLYQYIGCNIFPKYVYLWNVLTN
jgi:hypothetical protein